VQARNVTELYRIATFIYKREKIKGEEDFLFDKEGKKKLEKTEECVGKEAQEEQNLGLMACLVVHATKKKFVQYLSHRILRHMPWSTKYRRKKKLITQFSCKSRDKSFEPN
jgi:hypothetical protein